ncbi:MAG TPA: cytochrome P450 [Polyangiaceae bacterium]|nr:cytochrome P450 [Polyangiaceae bacterium]
MTVEAVFDFSKWLESPNLEDPYPLYAKARREAPVFYSPVFDLWFVTAYRDAKAIVRDPARFSSHYLIRTPQNPPPEVAAVLAEEVAEIPMLVNDDPPAHTRVRALVSKAFLPQRIAAMEPRVREIAERHIDAFAAEGSADVIARFAYPLPMQVICEIVGLPVSGMDDIKRWCNDLIALTAMYTSAEQKVAAARGSVAFQRWLGGIVDARRAAPTGDLLSALIEARVEGQAPLSREEIVSLLITLIFGGHETTTNMIGNALLLLFANPGALAAVKNDRGLLPAAVEESLRMDASIQGMMRTTTEPVELGGVALPKGAKVFVLFAAANRDPAEFPEPDAFELRRPNVESHLAFGRGIHFCMGAALARLEIRVALEALFARLPDLRLAPGQPYLYVPTFMHRGPKQLRLTWGPA